MTNFFTLWRREFTACFLSPIAYVTMVVFLATSGGIFFMGVLNNVGTDQSLSSLLFGAVLICMTALISVVSMRLFAEEKRCGTIETLMTAPVTDAEVVLGKYAGALSFVLIVVVPALANIFVLAALSPAIDLIAIDPGALLAGCLILFLVAAFFTAVGLLVSLMTNSQIVAAICCFCILIVILLIGNIASIFPIDTTRLADFSSPLIHIDSFSRGSIDTRPIVLYLSCTILLLFVSVRVLESRRWK